MKESFYLMKELGIQPSEIDRLPEWERRKFVYLLSDHYEQQDRAQERQKSSPKTGGRPTYSR